MSEHVCSFDGCPDPVQQRGLCWGHLAQLHQGKPLVAKRRQQPPRLCGFPECGRRHAANGWCQSHNWQAKNANEMTPIGRVKVRRSVTEHGYVKLRIPEHPNAHSKGWVFEHTVMMAEHLGRALLSGENVHHKNGDRADNRIENLELWSHHQPKGQRVEDKVAWAIELLHLYRPELLKIDQHIKETPSWP